MSDIKEGISKITDIALLGVTLQTKLIKKSKRSRYIPSDLLSKINITLNELRVVEQDVNKL